MLGNISVRLMWKNFRKCEIPPAMAPNPIRAKLAGTLETSDYTSVQSEVTKEYSAVIHAYCLMANQKRYWHQGRRGFIAI